MTDQSLTAAAKKPFCLNTGIFNNTEVPYIKRIICSYGYAQEAVDMLSLTLEKRTLEEGSDPKHPYANGEAFWVITLKAPGSFLEMNLPKEGTPYTQLDAGQQAKFLAFEIGVNLMNHMGEYLRETIKGIPGDVVCVIPPGLPLKPEYETAFQNIGVGTYMDTLAAVLNIRLRQIQEQQSASVAPQEARKNPNSPKP